MAPQSMRRVVKHQHASPLFRLPAELRNKIYGYVLSQKGTQEELQQESQAKYISMDSIHLHAPSNELLHTCRRIYTEGIGIFIEAQRAFWRNNDFSLEVRDDWKNAEVSSSKRSGVWSLLKAQLDLIPKIIVVVQTKDQSCQYHFVEAEDPALGYRMDMESSIGTMRELSIMALLETHDLFIYSQKVRRLAIEAAAAGKYFAASVRYLNFATENIANTKRMVTKSYHKVDELVAIVEDHQACRKMACLLFIIDYCLGNHNAGPKPKECGL